MALDLSKVGERTRLKPRREPYWQRLRSGCFVGFRPSKQTGPGTWIARVYDEDSRKYSTKSLGDFGALSGNDRFKAAKEETEKLAEKLESGGEISNKVATVADACMAYAASRPDAEARFRRYVLADKIATIRLEKLRRRHLTDWRERLENKPVRISRSKDGESELRPRAPSTVNRDMAVLRAALSTVLAPGAPNTESAWQEALRAIPNANGRRTLYLDKDQRRKLLQAIDAECRPFVEALCLLPLRPGAMAAITAGDFDVKTIELTIGKDKTGKPMRIQLPDSAASLFRAQVSDKLPTAPLFMRMNGKPWDKNSWKRPIAAAVQLAGLPSNTTAYTLRHSTITDLVMNGLPLLNIAQISNTSVEMIERHYGHLTNDAATKALGELAL